MKAYITKTEIFAGRKDPSKQYLRINYVLQDGTVGTAIMEAPLKTPEVDIQPEELATYNSHDFVVQPSFDGKTFRVVGVDISH